MAKYSEEDIKNILKMHQEGATHKQIAEKVRPGVPSAWRIIGDIIRKNKKNVVVLPSQSKSTQEYLTMLDVSQHDLFISTYEDLKGEADTEQLTKAENEMLLRAAFSHVKYLNAQKMLSKVDQYLMMDLEGKLGDSDQDNAKKRLAGRGDVYKKEAEQWHREYMELMNDLKLTRKQRLDKIKDTRNTFLDLQQELFNKNRQESIIEDIKKINTITKEELIRLANGGTDSEGRHYPWLIAAFDEVTKEANDTDRQ